MVAPTIGCHDASLQHEALRLGGQRALLEAVWRVVEQLTRGLHRRIEEGDELLFGEGDMPVLALGEGPHDRVDVGSCGLRVERLRGGHELQRGREGDRHHTDEGGANHGCLPVSAPRQ